MRRILEAVTAVRRWLAPAREPAVDILRRGAAVAKAWGGAVGWFRTSFLPSQNYLIILSVVVGILTGLGSVGFVYFLRAVTTYATVTVADGVFGWAGSAAVVVLPAIGGLAAGPMIHRFAKEAKGHGVPEVMTALATKGGRIRSRVVMVKVVASSMTIGFGGTAGREGPMVQIGSAIGSVIGQWAKLTSRNIRTLVACGAAGGVAATFNAPIAGAIFAMEVLMRRIHADFLLVLLTSLSSAMIARHFLGDYPAFYVAQYDLESPAELPFYFLMGLLCGLAAIGYVKLLYRSEDWFAAWDFPEYLKPAVGGLFVGLILRFFPEIYGTGFPAMESALWVRFGFLMLVMLFVMEMIGNCATLGSGGSGGVFAPSLCMGAMIGGSFGMVVESIFPDWVGGSGAYAMVGMAAFFAAAAKAPTTSILILFEMTNDYRIMLPLMAATVGSVYLSHQLLPHSIYTLKLHQRGIHYPYHDEPEGEPAPASVRPEPSLGD
ncbi:MAG: chloride channel protein [bacterium]|nr:chloride channel protein [bacterium]